MHPKHSILLKKNAKRIVHTGNDQSERAFYFALDKSLGKDDQEVLHIDRKIKTSAKFNNVKKVNRTLEPFGDEDYQLSAKARMCAGVVNRSEDDILTFSVQVKKGIGAGQPARSLKKFKRLIGRASVLKDGASLDADAAEADLKSADHYLAKLEGLLASYTASRQAGAKITGDEALKAHSLAEEALVDQCIRALDKALEAARAPHGEDAAAAERAEAAALASTVSGRTLSQWLAELEGWKPWIAGGAQDEDDLELAAAIAEELREANLGDALSATGEQAVSGVSYFLLQQQEMFRRSDKQLDPVLSADELSLSRDGEALVMTEELLRESGLSRAFTLVDGQLRLKDLLLEGGVISPKNREKLAGLLVAATQLGFDLHMSNPSAGEDGAKMELSAREDGTFTQLIDRRRVASGQNLMFDRRQDIVPGSTPPRAFLDVVQEMNHVDGADFARLNDMLKDAWKLDQARGLVAKEMTFLQYKMQFVDLEVGGVDESGLRWHDNTGALGVEEWAFLALKVNDLPDRTQNNYYVEISWKGGSKPIERKLDIPCDTTKMQALLDGKNMSAVTDWIYSGLADEEWSRSGLGVPAGDKAGLIAAYKKFPINVKMGFWDDAGKLTWTYSDGFRPALINTMPGKDELVPRVNNIPEGALRTLLADEDGGMPTGEDGKPLDLSSEAGLKLAQDKAVSSMSDVVMTTALTAWVENSTESIGDLLKPIPDTQKVFLRQSNGTVNAVRIGNTNIRGALETMGKIPELSDIAEQLRKILTQPGVGKRSIQRACQQVTDIARKLGLDKETAAKVKAAIKTIADCDILDIGQTSVVTEGNDTGAFGKCAPTSYFCASVCGVSQAARDGFDLLHDGGMELRKASKKLEQMFSSGAMTEDRRKAIEEQIAEVERLVKDEESQRDEAREKLFNSPEWIKDEEAYLAASNETFDKQQALLKLRQEREDGNPTLVAARGRLTEASEQQTALSADIERLKKEIEATNGLLHPQRKARLKKELKAQEASLKAVETTISEARAEIKTLESTAESGPSLAEISKQLKDLDKGQIELRREYMLKQEAAYAQVLGEVEGKLADRKKGLERVKTLKESIVDRMVVKKDDDGPFLDMTFPIPKAAFSRSASSYSGGWLIKKVDDIVRQTGKSQKEVLADLGCREDPDKGWVMDVKVRPADIQEYLEQTNREDKYRGGKKHMMDFFKDPSSMNNIQLMKTLGPGLIAVGLDKGLKTMGKDSGLLYGPSGDVVATMVYNEQKTTEYGSISHKMPDKYEKNGDGSFKTDESGKKIESAAYKKELAQRRKSMIDKLKRSQEDGGSCSVSMGFSSANGHVNYVQAWGTPSIDGVEISSDDVARCRMNLVENAASSSAWNNDRVQEFPINTAAMGRGLDGIIEKMRAAGKGDDDPKLKELLALKATAAEATAAFDEIAESVGGSGMTGEKLAQQRTSGLNTYWARIEEITAELKKAMTDKLKGEGKSPADIEKALKAAEKKFEDESSDKAWNELPRETRIAINSWGKVSEHPDYQATLDKIRKASADSSDFFKSSMSIKHGEGDLNEENVLIMPSNTERDNRVTDTEEDVDKVGGGTIGSQKRGSANATDASYFVPVNALASGWDGEVTDDPDDPENKKCSATRYNYSDDPRDQFVMLSSFSTMLSESARRRW
jgi:hypothetical protein